MKNKVFMDDEGYRHEVLYDEFGKVVSDKRFDKENKLVGEGLYEKGKFAGRKEYFVDNEGYRHEAEFDDQDRPVSDKRFDRNGKLVGEGLYEKGKFAGRKEYFVDNEGYRHKAEFDDQNRPVSDKRFDRNGKLFGEGIYENGKYTGSKEYSASEKKSKTEPFRVFGKNEKLPKLSLAPGLGNHTVTLDLNRPEYKKIIDGLQPGEKLDIGRQPKSEHNIKIPEAFDYVSRQHCSIEKLNDGSIALLDTSTNGTGIIKPLDKENLPKLSLAPGLGDHTVTLDLNRPEYKKMIDSLQPGQEMAIGRQPKSEPNIKIPEAFDYVSRQHCSIKKMKDGSLVLIDTSTNGTDISISKQKVKERDDRNPPNPPSSAVKNGGNDNVPKSSQQKVSPKGFHAALMLEQQKLNIAKKTRGQVQQKNASSKISSLSLQQKKRLIQNKVR